MARLVGSSTPGDIERAEAMRLLLERTVLTQAVCYELDAHEGLDPDLRARTALDLLVGWMLTNLSPDTWQAEPHPMDGLTTMVVPPEGETLWLELNAASKLAQEFQMLWTADTQSDMESDQRQIDREVINWRQFRRQQQRRVTVEEHADPERDVDRRTWPMAWLATSPGEACPSCAERRGRPIMWGMPSPAVFEAIDAGQIDIGIGGCCVSDDDPTYECRACGTRFSNRSDGAARRSE